MAEFNLFGDQTVYLDTTADVTIRVSGKHIYANVSGKKAWQLAIYWDGNLINYAGGEGAYTDAPFLEAAILGAGGGNHTIKVTWFGHSSITLRGVNCIAEWRYK
jgi:hypothetical protein